MMTLDEARKNLSRTLCEAIHSGHRVFPTSSLSDPVAEAIESFVRACLVAVVGPKTTERNLPMWSPKTEKEPTPSDPEERVLHAIAVANLRPHTVPGWWQVCLGGAPVAILRPEDLAPLILAGDTAMAAELKRASDSLRCLVEELDMKGVLSVVRGCANTALSIVDGLRARRLAGVRG